MSLLEHLQKFLFDWATKCVKTTFLSSDSKIIMMPVRLIASDGDFFSTEPKLKTSKLQPARWVFDSATGYYHDKSTGLYYDSNSGFYYSDGLGRWVTQEEAYKSVETSKSGIAQSSTSQTKPPGGSVPLSSIKGGPAPGVVVTKPLNPMRPVKGAPSSIAVNKRKREDAKKPKVVSKEEEAALRAREAARKRVDDREKPLMGLYKTY